MDALTLMTYLRHREEFKAAADLSTSQPIAAALEEVLTQVATLDPDKQAVMTLIKSIDRASNDEEKSELVTNFQTKAQLQLEILAEKPLEWPKTSERLLADAEKVKKAQQEALQARRTYEAALSTSIPAAEQVIVTARAFLKFYKPPKDLDINDQRRLAALAEALNKLPAK